MTSPRQDTIGRAESSRKRPSEAPGIVITIDIKPNDYPNSINLSSAGIVPVAILSSSTFDTTQVNPAAVPLAGGRVEPIGKGDRHSCSKQDINNAVKLDLLCHVVTARFLNEPGDSIAVLEAQTFAGGKLDCKTIERRSVSLLPMAPACRQGKQDRQGKESPGIHRRDRRIRQGPRTYTTRVFKGPDVAAGTLGARDAALIRGGAKGAVSCIDRGTSCRQRHRLRTAAVVCHGTQQWIGSGNTRTAGYSWKLQVIAAIDESAGRDITVGVVGVVRDDGVAQSGCRTIAVLKDARIGAAKASVSRIAGNRTVADGERAPVRNTACGIARHGAIGDSDRTKALKRGATAVTRERATGQVGYSGRASEREPIEYGAASAARDISTQRAIEHRQCAPRIENSAAIIAAGGGIAVA